MSALGTEAAGAAGAVAAPEPLLRVEDLSVRFSIGGGLLAKPQVLTAVSGISLSIAPGETLGVVGESGCGKSTLGRAILRLIEPSAGRVYWRGRDLGLLDPDALRSLRRHLQIIFQDPLASLDPRMTVGAIIAEPLLSFEPGLTRGQRRDRVSAMMAQVGLLPEMINRYPHEFSGGQAQRIGIARAMIAGPELIVCDEPVSALDVSIRAQIINLLRSLRTARGLTLLFISHDLSVVRHISHRIAVLYLGRLVELADREAIFRAPRHPYTRALIAAVPIPDPDRERAKPRIVLTGDPPSPLAPPTGCPFRTRCPLAQARCAAVAPAFEEKAPGHWVSCHFAEAAEGGCGSAS